MDALSGGRVKSKEEKEGVAKEEARIRTKLRLQEGKRVADVRKQHSQDHDRRNAEDDGNRWRRNCIFPFYRKYLSGQARGQFLPNQQLRNARLRNFSGSRQIPLPSPRLF
jgi:hypothetical protein